LPHIKELRSQPQLPVVGKHLLQAGHNHEKLHPKQTELAPKVVDGPVAREKNDDVSRSVRGCPIGDGGGLEGLDTIHIDSKLVDCYAVNESLRVNMSEYILNPSMAMILLQAQLSWERLCDAIDWPWNAVLKPITARVESGEQAKGRGILEWRDCLHEAVAL
jgi:hypothetical protein